MVDFIGYLFEICDVEDDILKFLQEFFRIFRCEEYEECCKVVELLRFKKIDEDNEIRMKYYFICCDQLECIDFIR